MELFELIFILFAIIIFLIPYSRNIFMKMPIIGLIFSAIIIGLLSYFSLRWQMVAMFILYILAFLVFSFMNYNDNYKKFNVSAKLFRTIGIIFILVALILNTLFPINNLKSFKGKYYVGTSTISITDYNRQNDDIKMGKFRNLSARIFYPSYTSGEEKQKLIDNPIAFNETIKRNSGAVISKLINYVNNLESNSYYDVYPVEDKKFPLIVISHDWMEYPEYYYDIAEKIAADGYYVVVVNYTGNSPYTTLKNSNIEFGNTRVLDQTVSSSNYMKNVEKISSDIKNDFSQVLEGIEKLSKASNIKFANIDVENVGVIASGISARVALDTSEHLNVKAVIAYDPYVQSNPSYFLKNKFEKPSLILLSEEWADNENKRYLVQILENGYIDDKKLYYIKNFNHKDFTLMAMLSPLYRLNGTIKTAYSKSLKIKYDTSKVYFDYHLKNVNTKKHMVEIIESEENIIKIMLR